MPKNQRGSVRIEIRRIRNSLTVILRSLDRLGPLLDGSAGGRGATSGPGRRAPKLSPERRATLRLQGSYMGYMRQLPARQKSQVKALKEAKGLKAAIALAKRLAHR